MKVQIEWKYKDQTGTYFDDYDWESIEDAEFMYYEGNYSCDCNRSILFLKRPYGKSFECNSGKNKIEIISLQK